MRSEYPISFSHRVFIFTVIALLLLSLLLPSRHGVIVVNGLHSPFLDFFFAFLTNFGNGLDLLPAALLLSFRSLYLSVGIIAAGLVDGLIVTVCKRFLFPLATMPITMLDPSELHFAPGVTVHSFFSFPSGHTVTIFGICTFLALCYKINYVTTVLALFAFLVAISRVYLLQHFMIDIAAGSVIGTGVGFLGYHWIERMNKPQWMNQRFNPRVVNKRSRSQL